MRIFNRDKTVELDGHDARDGYLVPDAIVTHIAAVSAVAEAGHYETVAEYLGGGRDVKWVVDVPARAAVEEHDEREDIMLYIPYTEAELRRRDAQARIAELKAELAATDYKAIKFAEGELTAQEYAATRALRRACRVEINELEAMF